MEQRRFGFRELAMLLALVLLMNVTVGALAPCKTVADSGDTVTRLSNPEGKPGEADGYIGDREIGYGWSLAERDGYIYIGGWRNTVGEVFKKYIESKIVESGIMDSDTVWKLVDLFTNGEVPHPTDGASSGVLLKMDRNDPGNFEIVAETDDPFRHVCAFGDDLYFATYTGASGNNAQIWKLDKNDELTMVYTTAQGASMRANCVYQGGLYFAGTMADEPLGEDASAQLAVIRKHDNDDGWDKVADVEDFVYTAVKYDEDGEQYETTGSYASDSTVTNAAGSPFWDMVEFDGCIYCTIPNSCGFIVFKGRPASAGEQANKYGWVWTEVCGFDKDSPNNPGCADSKDGYADYPGFLSVVGALGVFKGQLYAYDIDNTIFASLATVQGLFSIINGNGFSPESLRPMYESIKHHQSLWRMDGDELFNEIEGFTELTDGTTNEYIWKHGEYNGEFYISTMDSKVLYNYLTRITGGSLFEMSYEEFCRQINYIIEFVKAFANGEADDEDIDAFIDRLEEDLIGDDDLTPEEQEETQSFLDRLRASLKEIGTYAGTSGALVFASMIMSHDIISAEKIFELMMLASQLSGIKDMEADEAKELVSSFAELLSSIWEDIKTVYNEDPDRLKLTDEDMELLEQFITEVIDHANSVIYDNFSEEIGQAEKFKEDVRQFLNVMKLYLEISAFVRNDEQGFDIYKSEDGDNWQIVTDNGFGDKFNYGALRFLTLEEGMYITTANPFYGGQLYLLTNDRGNMPGDLNGDYNVSNADLVMLARYLVHLVELDEKQAAKADYNGDGGIDNTDLVQVARYLVGA